MKTRRRRSTVFRRSLAGAVLAAAGCLPAATVQAKTPAAASETAVSAHANARAARVRAPKVMIVSMFGPEGKVWLDKLGPWQDIAVDGLSPDYPNVHCNAQDVCVM